MASVQSQGSLTSSGITTFAPLRIFPHTVTLGSARVTMHADGRFEGNADELQTALKTATGSDPTGVYIALWMLLRVLRAEEAGRLPEPPWNSLP